MKRHRLHRIASWLIAVMLFAALHPVVAAALVEAGGRKASLVEVCTSQGTRWVSIDTETAGGDAAASEETAKFAASEHCPLCRTLGDLPLDLSRADLRFAPPRWLPQAPPETLLPSRTVEVLLKDAPARAPPALT